MMPLGAVFVLHGTKQFLMPAAGGLTAVQSTEEICGCARL